MQVLFRIKDPNATLAIFTFLGWWKVSSEDFCPFLSSFQGMQCNGLAGPEPPHVDALCLAGVNPESYMTKVGTEWWCAVCSKVMARKDHMKNHIQIHFPGQEVSCPYCATICKNTPSLKVHMSSCRKMSFLS